MPVERRSDRGYDLARVGLAALLALLAAGCASSGSMYDATTLDARELAESPDSTLYDLLRRHSRVRHEPGSDAFFFHGASRRALLLIDVEGRDVALPTESEAFGTHGDYRVLGILRRGWIPLAAVERVSFERRRPRLESSWADCNCQGAIIVDLKPAAGGPDPGR